jgi:TolB-like protein/class 3 adenylate cyclase/Tfp pilus assembly protein PilF
MSPEGTQRKLTAILSADVKGYSRLMSQDEMGTIRALTAYKTAMADLIEEYRGHVVDSPGDNLLAEFGSVIDAVNCAVEIQRDLAERNAELPYNRKMEFRIGVNQGDIVHEEGRIYGDGVNVAARLEGLAEGGGICVSGKVYDEVQSKLSLEYEFLGKQEVKNIEKPVRVYRVLSFPGAAAHRVVRAKKAVGKTWRHAAMAIVAVLVLAAAVAVWKFSFRPPSIEPASVERMAYPLPDRPSIAVLPFVNLSDDPKQEYFSDGLAEEIITALSKVPKVFVIARNSTFSYKGKSVKVNQVAEELGVRYVLEGSVRQAGDQVRITAQLIDALTGYHLWAERYERDLRDIFVLQDEITLKIIEAMQVKLTLGEQARMAAKGTDNLEAYLKYLQASEFAVQLNREDNARARKLAEEAISLDAEFSMAYQILGGTHLVDIIIGSSESPKESLQQAFELANKALTLDDTNANAHADLSYLFLLRRQHDQAIAEAERAVALAPNAAYINFSVGRALRYAGRPEEAITWGKKAIRLDPLPGGYLLFGLCHAYWFAGRSEEGVPMCKKAILVSPKSVPAHLFLAGTYVSLGRMEEARAEAQELLKIDPKFSLAYWGKTLPFKRKTDSDRFVAALRRAGLPE